MTDDNLTRRVAAAMWKAEAVDAGTPQSVADGRTPKAFEEQSDYIRARWTKFARAAIAALPARGVGVKPLVWERSAGGVWIAQTGLGSHYSVADSQWFYGSMMAWVWIEGGDDAAKAAAQADYEARILSALDVTPAPTLAEALDVLPQEGERANVQRVEHCWPEKCWVVRWGPFASEKQAEAMLLALRRIAEGGE